ncbi:MAG: zinc ribbon domain-containing protein [Tepidiformaceae bacterium]
MSQVLDILTLQALDDEAAALRAALEGVDRRLLGDAELGEAHNLLAAAEAASTAAGQEQRRVEAGVADLTARIVPEEKRLYDGSVRNAKELRTIQQEIELLQAQRTKLEDELLEILERAESATSQHASAAEAVTRFEARWATDSAALRQEAARLTTAIASTDARREAQKAVIATPSLRLYEDLRRRKGGLAVARVQAGGACSGCRVSLPDAVRRKAFSPASISQCPNCERILAAG